MGTSKALSQSLDLSRSAAPKKQGLYVPGICKLGSRRSRGVGDSSGTEQVVNTKLNFFYEFQLLNIQVTVMALGRRL